MFATAHTSEANDSLFFSPPEIPRSRPGIPMYVSAHFVRPSFGRKTNGNGHRIPWIPFDSAETDLDDSSILGYPTDNLYIPPRNKSKNFLPLPFHSTCRNPIMFVGEERERKRGKRDTLRLRRRAQKCNLSTTVKL